jgi:hypothetical protein
MNHQNKETHPKDIIIGNQHSNLVFPVILKALEGREALDVRGFRLIPFHPFFTATSSFIPAMGKGSLAF